MTHVVRQGKTDKEVPFVTGFFKGGACHLIKLHGLLETSLLRAKVLHAQKMGSQAHVEQDDDAQGVLVRKGISSRQVSSIDQEGSVEDRKRVLVFQEERESMPQGYTSDREESASHSVGVLLLVVADTLKKPVDS